MKIEVDLSEQEINQAVKAEVLQCYRARTREILGTGFWDAGVWDQADDIIRELINSEEFSELIKNRLQELVPRFLIELENHIFPPPQPQALDDDD